MSAARTEEGRAGQRQVVPVEVEQVLSGLLRHERHPRAGRRGVVHPARDSGVAAAADLPAQLTCRGEGTGVRGGWHAGERGGNAGQTVV